MIAYLVIFGPAVAFLIGGYVAADRPETRWPLLWMVAAVASAAWLAYVALVPFEEGGKTFFGMNPAVDGDSLLFWVPLLTAIPCAVAGYLNAAKPLAIGAAGIVGPLLLAYPTTPRGDGDGLWSLIFLALPFFGLLLTFVASLGKFAGLARRA